MRRSEKLSKLWLGFACVGIVFALLGIGMREFASSIEILTFVNWISAVGTFLVSVGIAIKLISYIVESIDDQTEVLKQIERHLRNGDDGTSKESDGLIRVTVKDDK